MDGITYEPGYRERNGLGTKLTSTFSPPSPEKRAQIAAWFKVWRELTAAQKALWHAWTKEQQEASKQLTAEQFAADMKLAAYKATLAK